MGMAATQRSATIWQNDRMNERQDSPLAPRAAAGASGFARRRLAREWKTLVAMVDIYCACQHKNTPGNCPDCRSLLDYAQARLERCRFGVEKPTCAKCPVHCYRPDRREQVRIVMRFSGPRMLWRHPILAAWHWVDSWMYRQNKLLQ